MNPRVQILDNAVNNRNDKWSPLPDLNRGSTDISQSFGDRQSRIQTTVRRSSQSKLSGDLVLLWQMTIISVDHSFNPPGFLRGFTFACTVKGFIKIFRTGYEKEYYQG